MYKAYDRGNDLGVGCDEVRALARGSLVTRRRAIWRLRQRTCSLGTCRVATCCVSRSFNALVDCRPFRNLFEHEVLELADGVIKRACIGKVRVARPEFRAVLVRGEAYDVLELLELVLAPLPLL